MGRMDALKKISLAKNMENTQNSMKMHAVIPVTRKTAAHQSSHQQSQYVILLKIHEDKITITDACQPARPQS